MFNDLMFCIFFSSLKDKYTPSLSAKNQRPRPKISQQKEPLQFDCKSMTTCTVYFCKIDCDQSTDR